MASEADLEKSAFDRQSDRTFYAGIVFLEGEDDNSGSEVVEQQDIDSLGHIKYKIRMGLDSAPATWYTKPRYRWETLKVFPVCFLATSCKNKEIRQIAFITKEELGWVYCVVP